MTSIKMSALMNNEDTVSSVLGQAREGVTKTLSKKTLFNVAIVLGFATCMGAIIAIFVQLSSLNAQIEELNGQMSARIEDLNGKIVARFEDLESRQDEHIKSQIGNLKDHFTPKVETLEKGAKIVKAIMNSNNLTPRNCEEYSIEESGTYEVDPFKRKGHSSKMEVYCNSKETRISHDKSDPVNVDSCNDKNCFKLKLGYSSSLAHIKALIQSSTECHQDIFFTCFLAKITGVAGFTDINGNFHQYFHDNKTLCQCHDGRSCFSPSMNVQNTCHCDVGDTFNRSDTITIRDKSLLPLREFSYNLMNQNTQRATVHVGPLICKGSYLETISGDSCFHWAALGQPSGYYILPGQDKEFEMKSCDISNIKIEARLEIHQNVTMELRKTIDLPIDKVLVDGNEKSSFEAPMTGYYESELLLKQPSGCYVTKSALKVNGKDRSYPEWNERNTGSFLNLYGKHPDVYHWSYSSSDTQYFHLEENMKVSVSVHNPYFTSDAGKPCEMICSIEDPCQVVFSTYLQTMK